MNLSPDWCQALSQFGIESIHWSNVGEPTAPDKILMEWAKSNGYFVFTHDLDFGSILAATQADAPSVVQVRVQDTFPEVLVNTVVAVLGVSVAMEPFFALRLKRFTSQVFL